ncbi:MAG: NUDIX domain-containing protein [Bacteroidetes bacterium]|nr:NUDIX domain-containing protein [Bacteroidota bacterium]
MQTSENPLRKLAIQLIPGLLPLFIFILADEIWGTKIGLVVALVLGVIEFIVVWVKQKRIDNFILADTGLLLILGGVSLISANDLFFKLKPALMQVIFLVIMGIAAFGNPAFLLKLSGRYLGGINQINAEGEKMMQKMLKRMVLLISLHTLLVVYAAFYLSKEAWAFISGGLFYIIMGVYFITEVLSKRLKNRSTLKEEWFPLVDIKGNVIGKASRSFCHSGPGHLHPVVHLHIVNTNGELLIQKRSSTKDLLPNRWDTAVGGHVALEENIEAGLFREVKEEIGITDFKPVFLKQYVWETERESELVFSFFCIHNGPFKADPEELDDLQFWTKKKIESTIGTGVFTPVFENEYPMIRKLLK